MLGSCLRDADDIEAITVRDYEERDEPGWLRCRVLSFFDTCYHDDVKVERTRFEQPAIRLVAEIGGAIAALIDIEIEGATATIDSVAVHPDYRRAGLATMLLSEGLSRSRPRSKHLMRGLARTSRRCAGTPRAASPSNSATCMSTKDQTTATTGSRLRGRSRHQ